MHCSLLARATGEHCLQQCCTARASRHLRGNPMSDSRLFTTARGGSQALSRAAILVNGRAFTRTATASLEECPARGEQKRWYRSWPQPEELCAGAATPDATRSWERMLRRSSRRGVACSDQLWMCGSHWNSETMMQRAWIALVRQAAERHRERGPGNGELLGIAEGELLSPSDEEILKERKCRLWTARNC